MKQDQKIEGALARLAKLEQVDPRKQNLVSLDTYNDMLDNLAAQQMMDESLMRDVNSKLDEFKQRISDLESSLGN